MMSAELKPGKILKFKVNGQEFIGDVCDDHVNLQSEHNGKVFMELGVDGHALASEAYGYVTTSGYWPAYRENDYAALSRLLDKLIELGVEIEGYGGPIVNARGKERKPQFEPLLYDL